MSGGSARSTDKKRSNSSAHAHRVDRRDAEAVADRRVGRGAAALAEDVFGLAEVHDLAHGQEVAAVVELLDQGQLAFELVHDVGGRPAFFDVAARRAVVDPLAQPAVGGVAFGQALQGVAIAQVGQREGAARDHLERALDRLRVILEALGKGLGSLEPVLGVGLQPPPGRPERGTVPHACEHVLERPLAGVVVEHLRARDQRQAVARGALAQDGLGVHFFGLQVAGDEGVEAIAKRLFQQHGQPIRCHRAQEPAAVSAPQRDQALGMGADLQPAHAALALGRAQPPGREQAAQVGVALAVLHQQDDLRAIVQADLRANHELQPVRLGRGVGAYDAVDAIAIGERKRGQPEPRGLLDEVARMAGAFQEGEVAFAPKGDVHDDSANRSTKNERPGQWTIQPTGLP